ncbi:tumor necrosis factor ligand superfamily member 14-like [Sebastes fasciatus]|uniref:tumor necrosis factor ligand superfamily member 14-like n=1 Tax=Sebastes fasciatus TaxID=394691 RepID=UPI003D9E5037
MAEGGVSTCPQVFVVDSQAGYVSVPVSRKKPRWARVGQKSLLLLVGLALLGLVVEGCFIYSLYKKTQEFSPCKSHPLCQDLSGQQGDTMSQMRTKESNEIPTVRPHLDQLQQRPFAQLIGSNTPKGENNVVLWLNTAGETVINNMVYENGRLIVEKDGYYYLYSKVTLNASEECVLIQHKVMKGTKAYGNKIELMKSKSIRCGTTTTKSSSAKASDREDRWNSFLAGIFHLRNGDTIFVELENIDKIHPGNTENLMGAFMIFPGDMLK